jgi:hypothetical protein
MPLVDTGWTYGMNRAMSGKRLADIENTTGLVLVFEADSPVPDANGGQESFVPRHSGSGFVARADGSTRRIRGGSEPGIRWAP